jgi:hypothetical protein
MGPSDHDPLPPSGALERRSDLWRRQRILHDPLERGDGTDHVRTPSRPQRRLRHQCDRCWPPNGMGAGRTSSHISPHYGAIGGRPDADCPL